MNYYVDSDGVIADFDGWAKRFDPNIKTDRNNPANRKNSGRIYKLIVDNFESCFLDCEIIAGSERFIDRLKNDPCWFVLTAVPTFETVAGVTKDEDKARKVLDVLKENKRRFYENLGVAREKVIIVDNSRDKAKYAKGNFLYDDYQRMVDMWIEAGGKAELFVAGSKSADDNSESRL